MSMYLGGHFQVGYVWALPEGRLRIRGVLGRHDRSVRRAGRRPGFSRRPPLAKRAGPPAFARCPAEDFGELARATRRSIKPGIALVRAI